MLAGLLTRTRLLSRLIGGGESEFKAIVPGKPDESYLVEQITLTDGAASMPPKGKPLSQVCNSNTRRSTL